MVADSTLIYQLNGISRHNCACINPYSLKLDRFNQYRTTKCNTP